MDKLRMMKFTTLARKQLEKEMESLCCLETDIKLLSEKWFILYITAKYLEINKIKVNGIYLEKEMGYYEKFKIIDSAASVMEHYGISKEVYPYNSFDGGIVDECFDRFISEVDFTEPEIIGWMYQYYISPDKDRVFAALRDNIKVSKEDMPYATQLFTPSWIGRYLVENSLGRKFVRGGLKSVKDKFSYYIDDENDYKIKEKLEIEKIKVIDPCMGTGNILLQAYDILHTAYISLGYNDKDITYLIFKNNLYGTDIDDMAVKVGKLCLILKSASYNGGEIDGGFIKFLGSRMICIKDSPDVTFDEDISCLDDGCREECVYLLNSFKNGAEYGSTIRIDRDRIKHMLGFATSESAKVLSMNKTYSAINNLLLAADILSDKYDVVVTNPPYLGIRGINEEFASYLTKNYPLSKYDLCTVYMECVYDMLKDGGIYAMINQQSWMFLVSFEKLREKIIKEWSIVNMIHLGARAFEENVGTIVQNTAFVVEKLPNMERKTVVVDLRGGSSLEKGHCLIKSIHNCRKEGVFRRNIRCFLDMPRKPFAYWVDDNTLSAFKRCIPLGEAAKPRQGMASSDNARFVRYWYEVKKNDVCFNACGKEEAERSGRRWFPYRKGGRFRKWYGNNSFIIDWKDNGREIKKYAESLYGSYTRTIKNEELYFKKSLTYTFISEELGVRYSDCGSIFDVAGSSVFIDDERAEKIILGFMCSSVANYFLEIMNPTYNIQVGDLKNIPIESKMFEKEYADRIIELVDENIRLSREEWDDYEESWDFCIHPYIRYRNKGDKSLKECCERWDNYSRDRFYIVKSNEEELNRIFLCIYGLEGKVQWKVPDDKITMRRAELKDDMVSFISFITGCAFGRFKCDGYESNVKDNIIVISDMNCDKGLFNIVADFLRDVFGEDTLLENVEFIADGLGIWKDKTAEERIRRYIEVSFYKDHIKSYNGRPLYWMFSSGGNKAFGGLMYYHEFSGCELTALYNEYIPNAEAYYETGIKMLLKKIKFSGREMTKTEHQEVEELYDCIVELKEYAERIKGVVEADINLNYDDGIAANYKKFQDAGGILKNISKKKYN